MCKHKNVITQQNSVNGQSEEADKDKQTPISNDRVLVPDPEPNLEPFQCISTAVKAVFRSKKQKNNPNLNLLFFSQLLTTSENRQRENLEIK